MKVLRAAVSGSRKRYNQDGFDLDLTYITPKMIAMAYPATGMEKTYRNDINEVAQFLNSHHAQNYRVYNLSERCYMSSPLRQAMRAVIMVISRAAKTDLSGTLFDVLCDRVYDYSKFGNRVLECGWPDHHPPPLHVVIDIMNDMLNWVRQDDENIVVVHCLAGKGRTGVICSCFLLLSGFYGSVSNLNSDKQLREMANHAIRDFWNARGQGVRFPSQALYIYYFARILRHLGDPIPPQLPPLHVSRRMYLSKIKIRGIPNFESSSNGGCTPVLQVLPAPSQHVDTSLLYNSSWEKPVFDTYAADERGIIEFETNCFIQGDTLVRCFHASSSTIMGKHISQMFHFTFNTGFLRRSSATGVYRLTKREIDDANGNKRFPSTFRVDCHVSEDTSNNTPHPNKLTKAASEMINCVMPHRGQKDFASAKDARMRLSFSKPKVGNVSARPPRSSEGTIATPPTMGYLFKQGGFVKNWKRRWFVAREGKLCYYNNSSQPTPLGVVNLKNSTIDVCTSNDVNAKSSNLFYFKVMPAKNKHRTYYFGAESEQEMIKWIRELGKQSCYGITVSDDQCMLDVDYGNENELDGNGPQDQAQDDERWSQHAGMNGLPAPTLRGASSSSLSSASSPNASDSPDVSPSCMASLAITSPTGSNNYTYSPPRKPRSRNSHLARKRSTPSFRSDPIFAAKPPLAYSNMYEVQDDGGQFMSEDEFSSRDSVNATLTVSRVVNKRQMSVEETATVLNETRSKYLYTVDELEQAQELQKSLSNNRERSIAFRGLCSVDVNMAAEFLAEVVAKEHPALLDAFENDPIAFVRLIAGDKPTN